MELIILVSVLVVLLALGVPVAYSLLGSAMATFLALDIPMVVVFQRMAAGVSVFTLMAIPFFIFAGDLMYRSGIAKRLVEVAEGAIEEADRSTYYFQLGLGTNNPTTGKNFLGFASEGVDPQVNELRTLKFELEALEDVQIDKCVTRQGFFDIKQ